MMTCIEVAEFVLISYLEKDYSMIETRRLKNVVIFVQAILLKCFKSLNCPYYHKLKFSEN